MGWGGEWDVIRCESSPRKCRCPHLSPDSASSVVCVHRLPSAVVQSYLSVPLWSLCLPGALIPAWLCFPAFTSIPSSLLSNVSSDRSFVSSVPLLALFSSSLRQKRADCRRTVFLSSHLSNLEIFSAFHLFVCSKLFISSGHTWVHSPSYKSTSSSSSSFFPAISPFSFILSPWTSEMNYKRRS